MSTDKPTVVSITLKFSDGSESFAEGEHAQEVWKWYTGCETMAIIHDCRFTGKPMERRAAPERGDSK